VKRLCSLLIASCVFAGASAQVPITTTSGTAGTQQQPKTIHRMVATRIPKDSKSHVRESTAQLAAARANKPPLTDLPEFAAIDIHGQPTSAKNLVHKGHWLLVYQRPHCVPCDTVIAALAASESPLMKKGTPYVIVVATTNATALNEMRGNYASLSSATWVADSNKEAYKALKPKTAPVVYAMYGDKIEFIVPGTLGDPTKIEKLASSWLARKDHLDAAASSDASTVATPAVASNSAK
jgi:hypothetical protein